MTDRKKELITLAALLAVLILIFAKILFTDKIIRAPDITAEFLWTVKHYQAMSFADLFKVVPQAGWDMYSNGGTSEGGATLSLHFLYYRSLIFWLFPEPVNIAWFILFHLFLGGAGTYLCCRLIGCSRLASFLGGLVFAVAPESASLINAGHVQKIATISFAPWAFYFLERGYRSRRLIFFLATAVTLALQFFNMHWQIAFYTCLAIGAFGLFRSISLLRDADRQERVRSFPRLLGLNLAVLVFFLTTVAISLLPVSNWAKDTTRGVRSGANQGQGGLNVDEAMSWSLPPEELISFVIPGFFGLSRQEGGFNSSSIQSYYWGRMVFTQTTDYLGLLPWLLIPLPLIFRRDHYTWLALAAVVFGILFSLGRYTPFYWFLYEHFPGVNHFRVPKMMMFVPVFGMALLSARGLDLLRDDGCRGSVAFRRYLLGVAILPVLLLVTLCVELMAKSSILHLFREMITQPTRFEEGERLVSQRWNNLVLETGIAAAVAAGHAAAILLLCRRQKTVLILPAVLSCLYLVDTGRINNKFMLLQPVPETVKGEKTPVVEWLSKQSKEYRTLPMDGSDPMSYVANSIPVFFTSNPVQMQRWQNYLDAFNFASPMLDIMNVRYLVYDTAEYERRKGELGEWFVPVFRHPDGSRVVLENRRVMPKAWLAPDVAVVDDPLKALGAVSTPGFDPRRVAVVESATPIPVGDGAPSPVGEVQVTRYEPNRISMLVTANRNAVLLLGEKHAPGWNAAIDGKPAVIHPTDYILRGLYVTAGAHAVELKYDPLPFKIGKYLTGASLALFLAMLGREFQMRRRARMAGSAA